MYFFKKAKLRAIT